MKLRIVRTEGYADATGTYRVGDTYDCHDKKLARRLLHVGYAEEIKPGRPARSDARTINVETADAPPIEEKAVVEPVVADKPRGRKEKK